MVEAIALALEDDDIVETASATTITTVFGSSPSGTNEDGCANDFRETTGESLDPMLTIPPVS